MHSIIPQSGRKGFIKMNATEIIKAMNDPAIKLIEAVSRAIGKAYEPRYTKRMADAKAYEIEKISETMRNNSDLPIVYTGGETNVDISDYDSLRQRTGARLAYQEIRKQENIEAVVDKAYEEIQGKTLQSDNPVNQDWMSRFISNVGEVSDEEMQMLWAKVLAGEVIAPKTFSLKTLDCLRNLTSDDAVLFSKVCPFIIHNSFLLSNMDINQKYGIFYNDVLRLDDCGLLNSSGFITMNMKVGKENKLILDFEEYILMGQCNDGKDHKISIGEFPLSRSGRELAQLARKEKMPGNYIIDVSETVKKEANGCELSLHKVISRDGKIINFDQQEVTTISE